jgi:hypothetical protein
LESRSTGAAISSGERRLPASAFRQPAEKSVVGKLPTTAG